MIQLMRMFAQLHLHTFRVQFHRLLSKFAAACSNGDHEKILKALLKGDGATAEKAMRIHISRTGQWILSAPSSVFEPL